MYFIYIRYIIYIIYVYIYIYISLTTCDLSLKPKHIL